MDANNSPAQAKTRDQRRVSIGHPSARRALAETGLAEPQGTTRDARRRSWDIMRMDFTSAPNSVDVFAATPIQGTTEDGSVKRRGGRGMGGWRLRGRHVAAAVLARLIIDVKRPKGSPRPNRLGRLVTVSAPPALARSIPPCDPFPSRSVTHSFNHPVVQSPRRRPPRRQTRLRPRHRNSIVAPGHRPKDSDVDRRGDGMRRSIHQQEETAARVSTPEATRASRRRVGTA